MFEVREDDFDIGLEYENIRKVSGDAGAIVTFTGLVREFWHAGTESIRSNKTLLLEHYPGMTEKQLRKIENEAHERWELLDSLIIHRFGRLKPKDKIVLVITASAHRKAAFESCQFLMDWLKTKAPFWKMEETETGSHWVEAKSSDDLELEKWLEKNK